MKKYKLKGEQLVKKIKRESLTIDDLIDQLTWFKKEIQKGHWHLPIKIKVKTYNENADKSCTAILDSWTAGGNSQSSTLTLIAMAKNSELIDKENE